jgi:hypothetical protein
LRHGAGESFGDGAATAPIAVAWPHLSGSGHEARPFRPADRCPSAWKAAAAGTLSIAVCSHDLGVGALGSVRKSERKHIQALPRR